MWKGDVMNKKALEIDKRPEGDDTGGKIKRYVIKDAYT